ncbi:hypothetical protein [Leifsonia sp. NPDC058248]|uniref:hypothetical protein n=1 Tax=Leifsonia sp. NPDC058248 TaxID=3346402 RepID=UPI0036D77C5D
MTDESHEYRTPGVSWGWRQLARYLLEDVIRQLPADKYAIHLGTLFIRRDVEPVIAVVGAGMPDFRKAITVIEFDMEQYTHDENVERIIDALQRWRQRHVDAEG